MRIKVTAKDIEEGIPGDPQSCPVATALKRNIDLIDLHVEPFGIEIFRKKDGGFRKEFHCEEDLFNWISNYDKRIIVNPIEINLIHKQNSAHIVKT